MRFLGLVPKNAMLKEIQALKKTAFHTAIRSLSFVQAN
ncbi:hypothetical protein HMPREF1321_1466 [Capnocytophaga sp. oral taxon 412 str. F0487]|nr:hypothetical protein HMPREF1321_1466 [Capnocytophaga sp. oral taxon 412 str. F0487]